jgi:hypothetical protein
VADFRKREPLTLSDLERPAQVLLACIRVRKSLKTALKESGVSELELRAWLRDSEFAELYERAHRGEGPMLCVATPAMQRQVAAAGRGSLDAVRARYAPWNAQQAQGWGRLG